MVRKDLQESLGTLGEPISFTPAGRILRGGMVRRDYRVHCPARDLLVGTLEAPDGKLEQYLVDPAD